MAKSAKSSRKNTKSRNPDAIALLKNDHAEVTALFEKFEKGQKRLQDAQKKQLAQKICKMLTVHTRIEEEIFYPACREQVEDAESLLAEAKVEHQSAKELIAQIQDGSPGGEEYDAQVIVLGEYVRHHVKEEQNELFPKARKSGMDLKALGQELAERKSSLMAGEEEEGAENPSMAAQ